MRPSSSLRCPRDQKYRNSPLYPCNNIEAKQEDNFLQEARGHRREKHSSRRFPVDSLRSIHVMTGSDADKPLIATTSEVQDRTKTSETPAPAESGVIATDFKEHWWTGGLWQPPKLIRGEVRGHKSAPEFVRA